jgi:hypothetical protein
MGKRAVHFNLDKTILPKSLKAKKRNLKGRNLCYWPHTKQDLSKWQKGVLCESGFVLLSAPFLETRAFSIFLAQWMSWLQRT